MGQALTKWFSNFWVCTGMAVFSLMALWAAALEGETIWIAVDVFCIVYWVHRAYKTNRSTLSAFNDDVTLTNEQILRIKVLTRKFVKDTEDVINEAKDVESNNGEDKETDKKQSSDD